MKKIIINLITLIVMLCCITSTVSAYKVDYEIDVDGTVYSFEEYLNIATPQEYQNIVASEVYKFIKSEDLYAQVLKEDEYIIVNYYYTHTDVELAVKTFIEENNFNSSIIIFKSVGNENIGTTEKKDIYEALALISDFIAEENLDAVVSIAEDVNKKIIISTDIYTNDTSNRDIIQEFLIKENISESLYEFQIVEAYVKILGDADYNFELNVRDCAFIASALAQGRNEELPDNADFNNDGKVNVRDAAAIAKNLAEK